MFYRFVFIAASCISLAACSGSDDTKATTSATQQATATSTVPEPAKPAEVQAAPAIAPPTTQAANPNPALDPATCPYSADELKKSLGLDLSIVNAIDVPFAGGVQLSCQYTGQGTATVMVNKLAMQDPKMLESMEQFLAGSLEPIANDPDKAQWQTSDSGLHDLTLHYVRSGASIDIRVMGVDQNDWPTLKEKLVALRRIP
jgi:hypothetical protein